MTSLRPLIAWIIGPWVAAILVWIGKKSGQAVDPDLVSNTTNQVVDVILWIVPLLLSLAGVSKQLINKFVNPMNLSVVPEDPKVKKTITTALVASDGQTQVPDRLARDEGGYSRQGEF